MQKEDGIFISHDKYVIKVLRKFNFSDVKSASTLVDMEKTLVKDVDGNDVDVHLYRSMIRSLMYLTASRPDIIKSIAEGCQFLGSRLISCQCKKQTMVATFTTKAEYVAAGKKAIGTKLVFRNKKDERGIVIKNKITLVVQGHKQEEVLDYDEVFAPVARIEAIRVPDHPDKVYKVVKALYGLHQAPRAWSMLMTLSLALPRRSCVLNLKDVKSASTLVDMEKTLVKDVDGNDVDVHLYRSMIRSLMYLTASRPDIIDYPFELVAYTDSDYAEASLDSKSIAEGCQFLGSRLISCQCKKQTMVATSTTKAEYVKQSSMIGFGEMILYNLTTGLLNLVLSTARLPLILFEKPEGSEGFHQIVDFLNTSHISTLDNGEIEITATTDGKVKVKLEDSDGISILPTTKILKQLALMGSNIATALICLATNRKFNFSKLIFDGMGEGSTVPVESHHTPMGAPSTSQLHLSPTLRIPIRQETEVPQPSSPPHTNVADKAASTGVDVRQGGAATTITSLDAGQGSGNINKNPSMLHDLPLSRVHTLRSDEDIMQHNELMDLVTKLSDRVVALETDLKYDQDMKFNLEFDVAKEVSTAEKEVSTIEPVSTAGAAVTITSVDVSPARRISTADENTMAETLVFIRRSAAKDKAMRLQKELDEEERQRMAKVHEAAQSFSMEEWENIRARVKADEELTQKLQSKEINKYLFDELKTLFETTMRRVNTFVPMESEVDRAVLEFTTGSSKRGIEKELDQGNSKRLKTNEVFGSEQPDEEENELSQEDLQKTMMVVPVEEVYVEALQFKYPTIDWEVYTEESRKY
nr:hypothetical protein [Tanacetum cinerariifolium]